MAQSIIPVLSGGDAFTQSVNLGGKFYELFFYWNDRDQHWYIDISLGQTSILTSVKVVCSPDLLSQYSYIESLPPGKIVIVDLAQRDSDPDRYSLGDSVQVEYHDPI